MIIGSLRGHVGVRRDERGVTGTVKEGGEDWAGRNLLGDSLPSAKGARVWSR